PTLECFYAMVLTLNGDPAAGISIMEAAFRMHGYGAGHSWYRPVHLALDILLTAGDRERMAARLPEARLFDAIPNMHAACDRVEGLLIGAQDSRRANELLRSALE